MIPTDAASRLRLLTPELPAAPAPTTPTQQIADLLSGLVPGQRIFAEIQALLPNGAYRAVVGQRDVTLALPFTAKPGDALELEVVESDGKVSLAFVASRGEGKVASEAGQAVAANLSKTGRLIGDLLTGIGDGGRRAQPAALNSNQPLVATMPSSGAELVPVLKEALSKSGMFYESHQARWVEGSLPLSDLFQQPQGKLSPLAPPPQGATPATTADRLATPATSSPEPAAARTNTDLPSQSDLTAEAADKPAPATTTAPLSTTKAAEGRAETTPNPSVDNNTARSSSLAPIHSQLAPLVQQQLDALATQNYVWQGQIWPGQQMRWEISEEGQHGAGDNPELPEHWQTRLALRLPNLGGVNASLRLRDGKAVDIALLADSEAGRSQLIGAADALKQQLEAVGLALKAWSVNRGETSA